MAFPVSIKSAFCVISQCVESPEKIFLRRAAACQQNHGGSLTGAFDLICRSAVMLWHFRHNSGLGQTNHLWYGKLAHFTFYLCLAVLTVSYGASVGQIMTIPLKDIHSANWTPVWCYYFLFLCFFILLLLFLSCLHAYIPFQCGGFGGASVASSQNVRCVG